MTASDGQHLTQTGAVAHHSFQKSLVTPGNAPLTLPGGAQQWVRVEPRPQELDQSCGSVFSVPGANTLSCQAICLHSAETGACLPSRSPQPMCVCGGGSHTDSDKGHAQGWRQMRSFQCAQMDPSFYLAGKTSEPVTFWQVLKGDKDLPDGRWGQRWGHVGKIGKMQQHEPGCGGNAPFLSSHGDSA